MSEENRDQTDLKIDVRVVGRMRINPDRHLVFSDANLRGEDFSGRKLDQFCAMGSRFESCRFDRIHAKDACFGAGRLQSEYVECSFDGARMTLTAGGHARLVRCSFKEVDLRDWFCFNVELIDCTFTGQLRKVVFNGKPLPGQRGIVGLRRNEFRGNDFSGAELIDVAFRTGIDLSQQRLPFGPDYRYISDAENSFQRARAEAIGWQDLELRQVVLRWLDSRLEDVKSGQKQMLYRPKDYYGFGGMKREELDAYFELLRRYI